MADLTDATPRILRELQQTLTEMRVVADLDRRNTRTLYDNLSFEVARLLTGLEAKVELGFDDVYARLDRQEELLKDILSRLSQ